MATETKDGKALPLARNEGGHFRNSLEEGADPAVLLRACAKRKDLLTGSRVHASILKSGLLTQSRYVASTLVNMYAKCGALAKAQQVHDELPVRDIASWNALIAGFAQHQQGEDALKCFDLMQCEGHSPNAFTFVCALKACGSVRAVGKGELIHDKIVKQGLLEKDLVLGNTLLDMYVKFHALAKAQQVLDELPLRDVVTWNTLIAGYAQRGQGEEALKCFERMQCEGHSPNAVTFIGVLKACGTVGAADKGEQIHDEVVKQGLLENNLALGTSLLVMYAKCGALAKAQRVLDELPVRDVISWNALIAGYAQQSQGREALKCFDQMQDEGQSPDAVTFISALKACGSLRAADKGKHIHAEVFKQGLLEKNIVLGTALLDMYAKCGALAKAQQVLDELPVRNVVSWNALIAGYAQQGQAEEALNCFGRMQREGHSPNAVTFISILKACGTVGAADKGKQIHDQIVRQGFLGKNILLGNALVDMYAKCGALEKARELLNELPIRSAVSWNALISGYAQHRQGEEALSCAEQMQLEGHSLDAVTFICVLKGCASIGAVDKGKKIHDEVVRQGLLESNVELRSALVDMYVKCGALLKARKTMDELPVRDVVSWSALIAGYAQQGESGEVLSCFETMQCEGLFPDSGTLVCVLNACSHSGLLEEGGLYFLNMGMKYSITPDIEHHCCMVDLFGRAGEFNKALLVIEKMPSCDFLPVWHALLGACRKWGNVKLGRLAFNHAVQVDENDSAAYICMANIYAAAGMQEDADMIEVMRVGNKALKRPGCSWWSNESGIVHEFVG